MPLGIHHPLVLAACGFATVAAAQGPTFNCAKAKGEVEQQICGDASLVKLDRQLDAVYQAASAKASRKLGAQLRSEQRGWVKGRNDCWKATQQTWITAHWTVDTVKGCIDAQYRLRTSELQAVWQLLPPKFTTYACQDMPANEIVTRLYATDPATLRLERGDRSKILWQVGRPADGTYDGQNVSVVQQANSLTVNWLDTDTGKTEELACKAR